MAVDRSWRSPDGRWLVDQVVDEPGVEYRIWDAEGLPVDEAAGPAELRTALARLGATVEELQPVPVSDPWCE